MNKTAMSWYVAAAVVFLTLFLLQGCDLGSLVQVNLPQGVAQVIDEGDKVPLNDADRAYSLWVAWVEAQTAGLVEEIGRAREREAMIRSVFELGISQLGDLSSSFPGGALLVSALAGIGGVFVRQPGTRKREALLRASSFKQGAEVGALITEEKLSEGENG